jgi:hypothetical protein
MIETPMLIAATLWVIPAFVQVCASNAAKVADAIRVEFL